MLILAVNDEVILVCYQILENRKFVGGTKDYRSVNSMYMKILLMVVLPDL